MRTPYAPRRTLLPWVAAAVVAGWYGSFLVVTAARLPSGAELTGQFALQPVIKAAAAVLLALAAVGDPNPRERRWLIAACIALLIWFWPRLIAEGMVVPVTLYMAVLAAMVCAALLARLPTPWTARGALCFAVSDGMIGIGKFVLQSQALAVAIWWAYAASILLITAGFLFGRIRGSSDDSATPPM